MTGRSGGDMGTVFSFGERHGTFERLERWFERIVMLVLRLHVLRAIL